MKKFFTGLVLLVAVVLSVGFAQTDPKVLNFGVYFEPSGIDPHVSTDAAATWMANNIYDTLVRYDTTTQDDGTTVGTAEVKPWLAESWTVSDDGQTYVFQIRQGVTFQNGAALTAEDVVFSLQRVLTLDFAPAQLFKTCVDPDGIQATGDFEVTVTLTSTCPFFLNLLVQTPTGAIMDKDFVMEHGGVEAKTPNEFLRTNGNGTGPFMFANWEPGVQYELVAFENAWSGPPKLDRVSFRFISDLANQFLLLQQGRLDAIYNPPVDILQQALDTPELNVIDQQSVGLQTLYMSNTQPPFDDVRVRQAVMYALDPQEISDAATLGLAKPATSALPDALPGFNGSFWPYEHDVEKAKQLLAEAGHPNGFSTTIAYNSGNAQREISAVVAQSQLAAVGIQVEVQAVAWPTFVEGYQSGTMPMFVVSGLAAPVPDQFVRDTFASASAGVGGNYAFYSNERVDELVAELSQTTDETARQTIMDELQQTLVEDLPSAYLYNATLFYVTGAGVKDWVMYPSGDWFFNTVHKE